MRYFATLLIFLGAFFRAMSQNGDIDLLRKINLHGNEALDPAFRVVTNSAMPLLIAVPAGFITACIIKKDQRTKDKTFVVCSTVIISGVVTTALKYSINRKRPFESYADIEKETSGGGPSFPSGHTSVAFSLATSVSIVCPKWYVIAPSFLWASAVAYSRMDLGVHYPTDVLAGAIVGSGSAYLSYRLNKWYLKRKQKSTPILYEH